MVEEDDQGRQRGKVCDRRRLPPYLVVLYPLQRIYRGRQTGWDNMHNHLVLLNPVHASVLEVSKPHGCALRAPHLQRVQYLADVVAHLNTEDERKRER